MRDVRRRLCERDLPASPFNPEGNFLASDPIGHDNRRQLRRASGRTELADQSEQARSPQQLARVGQATRRPASARSAHACRPARTTSVTTPHLVEILRSGWRRPAEFFAPFKIEEAACQWGIQGKVRRSRGGRLGIGNLEARTPIFSRRGARFHLGPCEILCLQALRGIISAQPCFHGLAGRMTVALAAARPGFIPREALRHDKQDCNGSPIPFYPA